MKSEIYGILGGIGPAASLDFCKNLIKYNKSDYDQNHIQFILFNLSQLPDRPTAIITNNTGPLLKELKSIIDQMEYCNVTKIILCCNTIHYFIDEIQSYTKIPIINLIKNTSDYIKKNEIKNIGLLGTDITVKYNLFKFYIKDIIVPDDDYQKIVMNSIYEIKAGNYKLAKENLNKCIEHLFSKNVENIILGCTELPIVLGESNILINPNKILAIKIINEHNSNFRI